MTEATGERDGSAVSSAIARPDDPRSGGAVWCSLPTCHPSVSLAAPFEESVRPLALRRARLVCWHQVLGSLHEGPLLPPTLAQRAMTVNV